MPDSTWSAADREALARRGIAVADAERQLELLLRPPRYADIARPCTAGDGIEILPAGSLEALARAHGDAAAAGEIAMFIPASGAATRMFRDLLACLADGRSLTRDELETDRRAGRAATEPLRAFLDALPRLPFRAALERELERAGLPSAAVIERGPYRALLHALLSEPGLGCASLPKGLLLFHAGPNGPRTAFEEQLVDAAGLVRDRDGRCRLHFTVSPEHRAGFESLLAQVRERWERRLGVRYDVGFSLQDPATDALALEETGAPARDTDGALLLRPAGHGALLANLAALAAPIAVIRNVDNVASGPFRDATIEWTRALVGRLCRLRSRRNALLEKLAEASDPGAVAAALRFAQDELGLDAAPAGGGEAAQRALAVSLLDRPLRVCGMVRNAGEPGGGPFWVHGRGVKPSRQIVEGAEVDPHSPGQQQRLRAATHFNPVLMACALHDARGRPYPLERFADPEAVIVTRKAAGARDVIALEWPGLWNGGMAHWGTVFVEVPLAVFNPVKTVFDLLRPEHQGGNP